MAEAPPGAVPLALAAAIGLFTVAAVARPARSGFSSAYRERIPGGRASGMRPSDFSAKQLKIGTRVEMEHTRSKKLAREIAMDHLTEDPRYYDKLRRAGL